MDINNDTNISSLISNSISKLNLNTKQAPLPQKSEVKAENKSINDFKNEDTSLIEDNQITDKIDVKDIQKYASSVGESLSIDDINYGLTYGRSVIADYSV